MYSYFGYDCYSKSRSLVNCETLRVAVSEYVLSDFVPDVIFPLGVESFISFDIPGTLAFKPDDRPANYCLIVEYDGIASKLKSNNVADLIAVQYHLADSYVLIGGIE